jgi:hypothetical protein
MIQRIPCPDFGPGRSERHEVSHWRFAASIPSRVVHRAQSPTTASNPHAASNSARLSTLYGERRGEQMGPLADLICLSLAPACQGDPNLLLSSGRHERVDGHHDRCGISALNPKVTGSMANPPRRYATNSTTNDSLQALQRPALNLEGGGPDGVAVFPGTRE